MKKIAIALTLITTALAFVPLSASACSPKTDPGCDHRVDDAVARESMQSMVPTMLSGTFRSVIHAAVATFGVLSPTSNHEDVAAYDDFDRGDTTPCDPKSNPACD